MLSRISIRTFALGLAFASVATVRPARAELLFSPTFSYTETKDEVGGASSKRRETVMDVRVGYISDGLYVGGLYNSETSDWGSGSGIDEKATGLAASIGYIAKGGFNIIGSYFFMAERENDTALGKLKDLEGSGFQFDVGYAFDLGGGVKLGPQITYRSIEYGKRELAGVEIPNQKRKLTEVRPMIAFLVMF